MDNIEFTYTFGMDQDEIEDRLRANRTGVLSLARDGEAYAIPLAHYYDGENIYFRLGEHEGSEKLTFADATETATYIIYEGDPPEASWSIFVKGTLERLSGEEAAAFDATVINETFIPLRVFGESIDDLEPAMFRLSVEELTGRRTEEA